MFKHLTPLLFLLLTGNIFAQTQDPPVVYKLEENISYYSSQDMKDDPYKQEMCVLDFYYPKNKKDFPTIVWFHGGGLTGGRKEIPAYLKEKGLAVIGVGYRLSPKVKAVECIRDAAAATAWAFNNIERYGGNKSLIFVSGMSAGGYLTYMVGLDKQYLAVHHINANEIAGLIPFSGHAITHFTVRKEMGIKGEQPIIDEMAPLFHVRADASPLLILTGDRNLEMLGRYEENAYMMRMMKVAGHNRVRIMELDGSNHGQMMYPGLPILHREVMALTRQIVNSVQTAEIRPGELWPDNNGVHINAHGGGILIHDDTYYWFGEHKTKGKAGNKANVGVHVYSSKNLVQWKDEGIALAVIENDESHDITKECVLERPKVIYNKATKKFVMWFHLELKGQGYKAARTGLAVADRVTGPYAFVKSLRPNAGQWPANFTYEQKVAEYDYKMNRWTPEGKKAVVNGMFLKRDFAGGQMSRDMTLFVDDDGKAYHIAASEENGTLHVRELTHDYLNFTGNYVRVFPDESNEAPAVFKKDGKYYLFASGCTGWKPNPGRSAVADHILGPWKNLGNPFRGTEEEAKVSFHSQSTYVIPVMGKKDAFVYMGDRWRPENAIDGRYIWLPVQFDKEGKPFMEWTKEWTMDVFD